MIHSKIRLACSFCGKPQESVRRLIAGPNGVFICDECVSLCNDILRKEAGGGEQPSQPTEPAST